jgi:hypothetical protein
VALPVAVDWLPDPARAGVAPRMAKAAVADARMIFFTSNAPECCLAPQRPGLGAGVRGSTRRRSPDVLIGIIPKDIWLMMRLHSAGSGKKFASKLRDPVILEAVKISDFM